MTVPFVCVFICFGLAYLSKAPVALAQLRQPGGYDNSNPRGQQAELSGWGERALAAHYNAFEALIAFSAAVVVAHLAGADPAWSARLAVIFVVARVFYNVLYILDLSTLRSAVWMVGFSATGALFVLPWLT